MITISKFSNTIEYSLKTTLDSSGITKLQSELRNVQNEIRRMQNLELIPKGQSQEALKQINAIEKALSKAFNPSMGMLDSKKFSKILSDSNVSIQSMAKSFNLAGTQGTIAFNNVIGRLGQVDLGLKSISKTTDKVFNTIGNTVRWGIVASGFQGMMNSLHESVEYVKDLDRSLTDIMMVTDYSRQQMNEYAKSANEAAKAIGSTTVSMTDATLVFAQQGFNIPEASALAERSTKLANASQQQTSVTSDQITAMMNAYGIEDNIAEIDRSLDSWAEVANVSAADVKDIAVGFQKAGSTANTVGVSMDQLNAQIATIESVTREAPENIGNGLKTLYARFADIGMGETLEDGVDLGQVTQALDKVGVTVLDAEGKMNNVGDIMEQLMDVWSTLDMTQKNAIATTLAGKYQLSRFEALMNRSDLYDQYKESSENAEGTLDVMNEKYVNSLQGKMNSLQASFEGVINNLVETDDFYAIIEALTEVVDLFDDLIDAIGGGGQALLAFGGIATKVFSKNMAAGVSNITSNFKMNKQRQDNVLYNNRMLQEIGASEAVMQNKNESYNKLLNFVNQSNQFDEVLTVEQLEAKNKILSNMVKSQNELVAIESELATKVEATNIAYRARGGEGELITKDENNKYNFAELEQTERDLGGDVISSKRWLQENEMLEKIDNNLYELQTSATKFEEIQSQVATKGTADWGKYESALSKVEKEIDFLSQDSGVLGKHFQKIRELYLEFQAAVEDGKPSKEINKLSQRYREATQEAQKLVEAVRAGNIGSSETFENLSAKLESAISNAEYDENRSQSFIDEGEFQKSTQTVINTAAAVSQLAFVWNGFQSLGSIWANEDLDAGEKLNQTIMNLAMNIPMLISGIQQLGQVTGANTIAQNIYNRSYQKHLDKNDAFIKSQEEKIRSVDLENAAIRREEAAEKAAEKGHFAEAKANQQAAAASRNAANQHRQNSIALEQEARSSVTASVAAKGLSKAMSLLGGPLGMAFIALQILSTAIGAYNQQQEQMREKESENLQAAQDTVNGHAELYKSWETLADEYKKTGKASDEFRAKSVELAEQLGIEGAAALDTAGQYDALTEAIKRKRDMELKEAIVASEQLQAGATGKLVNDGEWNDGSSIADAEKAMSEAIKTSTFQKGYGRYANLANDEYAEFKDRLKNDLDLADVTNLESFEEAWANIEENIQKAADALEQLKNHTADEMGMTETEYKEAQKYYEGIVNAGRGWQDNAENQEYYGADKSAAENAAQLSSFQEGLEGIKDYQSLMEYFEKDPKIAQYFKTMYDEADKANFMLSQLTDTAQQEIVLNEQRRQSFQDKWNMGSTEDSNDFYSYIGMGDKTFDEEWRKNFGSSIAERINNLDLTEDAKIELYGYLDKAQIASQVNDMITGLENGEDLEKLAIQTRLVQAEDFTKYNIKYSPDEQEDILEKANLDEDTYLEYKNNLLEENSDLYKEIEENAKQVQDVEAKMAGLDVHSPEYQQLAIELENLQNKGQGLDQTLSDLTLSLIDTQNGLNQLAQVSDEQFDALRKGDEYSQDFITGLKSLKESMSQVLNIDPSMVSQDFIVDNLDAIYALAEGDLSKLDELRLAMGEDMILNLNLDWSNLEVSQDEFLKQYQDFSNSIEDLEIGANLDDTEFVKTLNHLLESGAYTQEEMSALLSGINMDYNIDYKTMDVPQILYETINQVKQDIANADGIGGMVSAAASGIRTVAEVASQVSYTSVPVPYITAKKGAAGSGGGAKSPTKSKLSSPQRAADKKKKNGSGKEYKPKTKDPIEEEVDRYQKVNAELSDVENTLSRINKEQERSTGFDLGDNMDKQIGLLQKQLDITKEKYKIQQQEAAELKSDLSKQFGVGFDGDGMITNYRQTLKQLENEVNGLINKYNSTTTEEGQEALEEKIEAATERLEDFKKMYQRYDTLWSDELRQSEEAIEDLTDQIEDLRIEAFKTAIEVVDNIKDMNEAMVEFEASIRKIKSLNDDDPFGEMADSTKRLSYYFDDANGSAENFFNTMKKRTTDRAKEADKDLAKAQKQLRQASTTEEKRLAEEAIRDAQEKKTNAELANRFYNTVGKQAEFGNTGSGYLDMATYNRQMILEQVSQFEKTGTSEIFGKNSKALYDTAKEVLEQSQQMINDFADEIIELQKSILDSMDKMQEQAEELHAEYENLGDSLEHLYDITEKVQGDQSYDMLNAILDKQIANNQQYKSELENELKIWQSMEANLEKGSEAWKNAHEKVAETQKEINDLVSETFDMAQKKYENSINKITSAWTNGMMNLGKFGNGKQLGGALDNALRDENGNALFKDIDWMATEWELINRNADYYLDEVNKSYNIQKLQNKYVDLLNEAQGAGLGIQSKISAQMRQQLEYLRDKKNLSEYDIAYAEAQLDILQKQIALEEARNNKNEMRLRRDSQGNYRYQYVANEGDTKGAENDLLDAQNNAYNLSKEQMKQTQADSLSALQDAKNTIDNIWTNANDSLATKKAKTQKILDSLKEYIAGTSEQLNTSETNIINDFIAMTELLTEENKTGLEDIYQQVINGNVEAFDVIDTRWSTSLTDWLYNMDIFEASMDEMYQNLVQSGTDFAVSTEDITGQIKDNWDSVTGTLTEASDAMDILAQRNADFIAQMKNDAKVVEDYNSTLMDYQSRIDSANASLSRYQEEVDRLNKLVKEKEAENLALTSTVSQNGGNGGSGSGGSGGYAGTSYDKGALIEGIAGEIWTYGTWGDGSTRLNRMKQKFGGEGVTIYNGVQSLFNGKPAYGYNYNPKKWESQGYSYYKKFGYSSFDTGGYTGRWSDGDASVKNGKLAVLHQKELVLNEHDTENMLKIIQAVRSITSELRTGVLNGLGADFNTGSAYSQSPQEIQQQVQIDATFPNVTSSNEIETAILGLIDQTPQYVMRTR